MKLFFPETEFALK